MIGQGGRWKKTAKKKKSAKKERHTSELDRTGHHRRRHHRHGQRTHCPPGTLKEMAKGKRKNSQMSAKKGQLNKRAQKKRLRKTIRTPTANVVNSENKIEPPGEAPLPSASMGGSNKTTPHHPTGHPLLKTT